MRRQYYSYYINNIYLIIIQNIAEMRNRNTLGQWKPPQRNISNSVQRRTLTNPQTFQQTQSRALTQHQINERISKTINEALMKLPSQGKRTSISTSIQPKASNLISNIGSFMALIDRSFQKSNIDVQSIPQLLTFWGYPQNYNKSVFQPVGAPHTWPVCLQMMEFLAEIGLFIFEYRLVSQQFLAETQEIDLVLEAFTRDDLAQYQNYLSKIRNSLIKQQQQLTYKIQSSELTIKNIKNSQRSLNQMQSQEKVLYQKLQRQSQNVIEIDQKNNSILSQIQHTDDQIQQLQFTKDTLLKKVNMLQQEINIQQLSLEQATRIECQIKQYNSRIKDAQQQAEIHKKQYENHKSKLVQNFYRVIDDLNEIKNSMKKYQVEMQKRNIEIPFPQADHVAFTEAIHAEDIQIFNQSVSKMIQNQKIKAMLIGQQSLADILEHEVKNLNNNLTEHKTKKKQVEHEKNEGSGQLSKLQKYWEETLKQLDFLNNKRNQNLDQTQILKERANTIKLQNQQLLKKQIEFTQQTKKRKEHMVEGIKLFTIYQADCERTIKNMEEQQKQTQKKIQQILKRLENGFNCLNNELQSLL